MGNILEAVAYAEFIAANDTHGYDQEHRNGPDYDCSSLVLASLKHAGFNIGSATYTGNMGSQLVKHGFTNVINSVNLNTQENLKRGDILLSEGKHVVFYSSSDKVVGARINEFGKIVGGRTGDQTGEEISVHKYYNKPWTHVLRFSVESKDKSIDNVVLEVIQGKWGAGDLRRRLLTEAGYDYSTIQEKVNSRLGFSSTTKKSINTIAKEVIQGKWGNGSKRKELLLKAGYSYTDVQKEVNKLLVN